MTYFPIIAGYIAFFLLMNIVLMYLIGKVRIAKKIDLGDGGDAQMLSRVRAHGNFSETVPISMLGLICLDMLAAPIWALHLVGGGMVVGRVLHALGMYGKFKQGRLVGTLTFLLLSLFTAGMITFKIFTS